MVIFIISHEGDDFADSNLINSYILNIFCWLFFKVINNAVMLMF